MSRLSRLWTWTKRVSALFAGLGVVGAIWAGVAYKRHVLDDPGEHIQRDAIQAIIAQESPVLYSDGETRIGVFFSQEHREYVPYERIPRAWVDAIVAAEDQRFFSHPGVDPKGIARAMRDNVKAKRVVAGGSSLTQQTAKNLYYRPDRSMRSKWEELVNALRLEAHYDKEDILEFYANQFHVSANGRGLGIAARYFFDKDVSELTTLECAYLAGMVKAPATYNPFLGSTSERRELARQRAQARTRYVLDRMLDTGAIDAAEHATLITQDIPFRKGTFRYDTHVVLDEVEARLQQAPFPALFAELGIDNPSTAGIEIVTTIDAGAQAGATWALWHHLTESGPLLEAPSWGDDPGLATARAFRLADDKAPAHDPHDPLQRWEFSAARVTAVQTEPDVRLHLDIGGHTCVVDADAIERAATVVARARKGESWRQASKADRALLVDTLPAGAVVWASVLAEAVPATDGGTAVPARCDLELRPELQGAVIVLEDGRIRAMVGGNDNKNFNRATQAKRQLGSTWKPVLFYAGLQLGWLPTDDLDNRPDQVFRFEGTWYYPRPDHESHDTVSLAWAGTRSENLASIWLLAHLTDKLDDDEFEALARQVDLVPRNGEARDAWIERIRDDQGVISTESRLPEIAFHAVRGEVADALDDEGRHDEAWQVRSLLYGSGADSELARVRGDAGRRRAVGRNLLHLEERAEQCVVQAGRLQAWMDAEDARAGILGRLRKAPEPLTQADVADLRLRPAAGSLQLGCGEVGEGWAKVGEHLLGAIQAGVRIPLGDPEHMLVEGVVEKDVLDRLRRATTRRRLVLSQADAWSFEVLAHHPDYRQLVGMRYLAQLATTLGVQSELPPVLSMPLGAVDISVEEAASMYQGMLRGETWTFPGQLSTAGGDRDAPAIADTTVLIAEIRDRSGKVLYRVQPEATSVTDPAAGRMAGDILRNVVRWGTGRRALSSVTQDGAAVPVAGKTGTTNGYRNAAFVGFVPRAVPVGDGARWEWGAGYTVAAYVGYDDNRAMRRGGVRLQGASGALPAWIGTAQALADVGLLGDKAPTDPEWVIDDGFRQVAVEEGTGRPVGDDPALASTVAAAAGGRLVLVAHDQGVWGLGAGDRRIVAPVRLPKPADEASKAAGPGKPSTGGPVLPPDEAAGEVEDAVPTEEGGSGGGEEELPVEEVFFDDLPTEPATEGEATGADSGDPVRAWLGEYLEGGGADGGAATPAPGDPEPSAPDPDGPGSAEPDAPPAGGSDSGSGGIVPRIAPAP
ncbi:MAG: transglycosylase domain-containing protein [Alphaproteobacteria bacterium]|nr:transglycosylase domain-containing protein [Alphaproteobacteria bacterium]